MNLPEWCGIRKNRLIMYSDNPKRNECYLLLQRTNNGKIGNRC